MFEFLHHLFLPHHTNNFRAKLLQHDFFLLYVIAFLVIGISLQTLHRIDPQILGFATDIRINELLDLVNSKRIVAGETNLKLNSQLSEAAAGKARDMFNKSYWAHTAPDGTTPWDFINSSGYVYTVAGENLAKNFNDSSGVVEAWMNSPSHRENILRAQYEDVGYAVVNGVLNGEETTLVVQMFGKSLASANANLANKLPSQPEGLPIAQVNAETESTPVARFVSDEATPTGAVVAPSPRNVVSGLADSVVKSPLFDIGKISKNFLLGLSSLLMLLLVADGVYVWRHRIVRASGRNTAHLLFLFIITGMVWLMSFGSII